VRWHDSEIALSVQCEGFVTYSIRGMGRLRCKVVRDRSRITHSSYVTYSKPDTAHEAGHASTIKHEQKKIYS
jgi:hypothetical protein